MTYEEIKKCCHIRSGIYRKSDKYKILTRERLNNLPVGFRSVYQDDIGKKVRHIYWINHSIPLDKRVPDKDKQCDDWVEYNQQKDLYCPSIYKII